MFIFRMGLRQKFVLMLLATVAVLLFAQWAVSDPEAMRCRSYAQTCATETVLG